MKYNLGQYDLDQYDGEKIGEGTTWELSQNESKGAQVWTRFQSKNIIKKLPEGTTRNPSTATFKHEGEESIS